MDLEKVTTEIKNRETARFNYTGKVVIKEEHTGTFTGVINLLTVADITVGYNPDFIEEAKPLEKIVKDPFQSAFTAVLRHELNHKGGGFLQGCPRTMDLHVQEILEPIAETLKKKGFANVPVMQGHTLYSYIANMFEDWLDNSEIGNVMDHIGLFVCYDADAKSNGLNDVSKKRAKKKADKTLNGTSPDANVDKNKINEKISPLFDAFIQLQEKFIGGKRSKKLMDSYRSHDKNVDDVLSSFMKRSTLQDYKITVFSARKKIPVQMFDRKKALSYCLDEKNWKKIAIIFAEEFSKLIDKKQLDNEEYVKKTFQKMIGESDTFEDELSDPDTMMKYVWKKFSEGEEDEEINKKLHVRNKNIPFNPPAYVDSYMALDVVYKRIARNLDIKTETPTITTSFPIMHYGRRMFDPEKDKISKTRLRMGDSGYLELFVKRFYETIPIEYTKGIQKIPDIKLFVLDTSGSMKLPVIGDDKGRIMNPWAEEEKQWGNKSRYHYALVAWYGLQEFLRKQGALKHATSKLINYSSETKTAKNLDDARKLALTPQFGGTSLELSVIEKLFGKNELIISVSDGDMSNWSSIKEEYIRRAKQNQYVHIQIGEETIMTKDLVTAGLLVVYDTGENMAKLIIDFTRPYVTRKKT